MSERKVLNELALFAGAGGGILGGYLLGWKTICAVEIEDYPRRVLLQRQKDGIFPHFPIWDDIRTFDGRPWSGAVDIITGGFPCQDISAAGKGAGLDGEKSGLWHEVPRVVREVDPKFIYLENSPMLTLLGLDRVLADLAALGYNARWCVLGADAAGAPHKRERIWILAYRDGERKLQPERIDKDKWGWSGNGCKEVANTDSKQLNQQRKSVGHGKENTEFGSTSLATWWENDPAEIPDTNKFYDDMGGFGASEIFRERSEEAEIPGCEISNTMQKRSQKCNSQRMGQQEKYKESESVHSETVRRFGKSGGKKRTVKPIMGRVAHGITNRVDRLKAIGNGQVPATMAYAFLILSEGLI